MEWWSVAAGAGLIFPKVPNSGDLKKFRKFVLFFFVPFASQLPSCEYFVHQYKKFVGFFCSTRIKLRNNNKNNKKQNKRKPKREGRDPSWHTSSSPSARSSLQSACGLYHLPNSLVARARWQGHPPTPPRSGLPFLLLTGALLPQSSEMERRLKIGRRRLGSRLGDSEPLRLPELREPLK